MIRNYTVSNVEVERVPPRTNRFPIALWCFLSRGRFCFLVNQPQQIFWGLATPWAGECSGRNVGRKRGEAISWWISCWQVSGPWESHGTGISPFGEQPKQQKQCLWSPGGNSQVTAWATQATSSGFCRDKSWALSSVLFTPLFQSSCQHIVVFSEQVLSKGDN